VLPKDKTGCGRFFSVYHSFFVEVRGVALANLSRGFAQCLCFPPLHPTNFLKEFAIANSFKK